jgi:SNF2-related domain/SNF2 Helicase protein/Helicase conserved C-terminal domain
LSLPTTATARRAPLELSIVLRGGEEPLMGFYSVSPLTPGGWSQLLDEAGLPHSLRRLSDTIMLGRRRRAVEFRCLAMLPALAYLLGTPAPGESASVRAWRLAARVVEQAVAGGRTPDLSRFAAAFPATAHATAPVDDEEEPLPDPVAAVSEFVDSTMRALAAAVREPRRLTAPDAHAEALDLGLLQPSLRAVAPDLGAVAPVVHLRDQLELALELEMPEPGDDRWPLRATPSDPGVLSRAARIFPALAGAQDGHLLLDLDGVAELRLAASALEFAGATVRMPAAISEDGDLDIDVAELRFAEGPLAIDGTVHFDLDASLGGRPISREEFRELAAASRPLVRLGGEWHALSGRAMLKAKSLAQVALHGSSLPALTALGATLAGVSEVRGLQVSVGEADGELTALADTLRAPELWTAADPGPGFHGTLRPYQRVGLGWLLRLRRLRLGALLADDMGLGKTVQVIAYLLDRSDDDSRPTLIVAPTSVLGNWERELGRFAPGLSVRLHHGPDRTTQVEDMTAVDVVITSYALLPRDRALLRRGSWRALVLDEAQAVKNPLTRAAQTARALEAGHRVALTGTPVENRLDELWSIMHILNPGLLGTRAGFRRLLATPIERHRDDGAEARLRRMTHPFLLRRRKSDPAVLPDLPPRQDSTEFCTLTLEQASLYQATIDAIMGQVRDSAGIERRGHVLALITRLKQVCNHPAHATGRPGALAGRSGKLDRLTEMLAEALDEGDNALVFTQYAVMGNLLAGHLEKELGTERLYLDGSTPRQARESIVDRFQRAEVEPRVLVASLRAGGTGLNLTAASHVFHFDRWWNPAVEDQASDRAHRIGQTRVVQVHRMVCAGTIEERIDALIASKRELAERIVDRGAESALVELPDDELADLVRLRE